MPNDSKVFLDYTQAELDRAYDQLVWAPHRDAIQAEIRQDCEAVRRKMPPRTERYGKSEVQLLDVFAPGGAARAPVLVYLHGCAGRGWIFAIRRRRSPERARCWWSPNSTM